MTDVEILVHTAAPSRAHDDTRYRTLAQAYIHFVTVAARDLKDDDKNEDEGEDEDGGKTASDVTDDIAELVDSQLFEELWNSKQEGPASWESYHPDNENDLEQDDDSEAPPTQELSPSQQERFKSFVSPQLSFDSVLHNADSPRFQYHITCAELPPREPVARQEHDSAASWRPPPTFISDSQPDNDKGLLAFSSPTTTLELYLQQVDSSDIESTGLSSPNRPNETLSPLRKSNTRTGYLLRSQEFGNDGSSHLRNPYGVSPAWSSNLMAPHKTPSSGNAESASPSPSAVRSFPLVAKTNSGDTFGPESYLDGSMPGILPPTSYCSRTNLLKQLANSASTREGTTDIASAAHGPPLPIGKSQSSLPSRLEDSMPSSPIPCRTEPSSSLATLSQQLKLDSQKQLEDGVGINDHISAPPPKPELQSKRRRLDVCSANISPSGSESCLLEPSQRLSRPQKKTRVVPNPLDDAERSSLQASGLTPNITSSISTGGQPITSWTDKIEIHPQPPATSSMNLTPEMLITGPLQTLAQKMPMEKLYNPVHQRRTLRPMERGYWLIKCNTWKDDLRLRNWNCLGNYVGKGMAGWGVWCVRDGEFGTFRVYCWGILVGYVYLLLFMTSESKVKRDEALWIDANGEAIIRMAS